MVSGTFGLGRLFGVRIQVHFSWVFIFALIAWSLASSWLPSRYVGWSTTQYWTIGIIGSALLFVCVLIHELSHSLEATRRGLRVKSITLFFLGGFSQIDGESRSASEEFWVSVVGPIASLGLACIFGLIYLNLRSSSGPLTALTQYLMFVNLMVGLFNLIPAFPLDGGRVLRSLVWKATRSQERATRVASLTGSALGFGLIGVGVVRHIHRQPHHRHLAHVHRMVHTIDRVIGATERLRAYRRIRAHRRRRDGRAAPGRSARHIHPAACR